MAGLKRSRILRLTAALLLAGLLLALPGPIARAQDYGFTVDRNLAWVYIQEDGSVDIVYRITFTCDSGAHPIDIVDIGLPNQYYDLTTATATIDDLPVASIRKSEWLDNGVEVHLGSEKIMPGETGRVRLEITNPHMVYQDSEDAGYASVLFSPNWFGSEFTHGTTDLRVTMYFPPGVRPEETRYLEQFTQADMVSGRPVMTWIVEAAQPDRQYTFGVSFPRRYVQKVYVQPGEQVPGASPRPTVAPARKPTSGSTTDSGEFVCDAALCLGSIFFSIVGGGTAAVKSRRKRMDYMPPLMSVEGMGIKRGLTAVEAAVLLEAPLNKVLTMILFGLVKKQAVRVTSERGLARVCPNCHAENPLDVILCTGCGMSLRQLPEAPEMRTRFRVAESLPEELYPYENDFLAAISEDGTLENRQLMTVMTSLIQSVSQKMKGFHAKDTIAYYRDIVARAWKQVEAPDTPELVDQNLEWMMADEAFEQKMSDTFGEEPIPMPIWWWADGGAPAMAAATPATPGQAAPLAEAPQAPPGSQFANSVVNRIEGISNTLVRDVSALTTGVADVTHPVAAEKGSGLASKGGGFSCACACACAGCACACAGGGR
jgi:hypothetical protein